MNEAIKKELENIFSIRYPERGQTDFVPRHPGMVMMEGFEVLFREMAKLEERIEILEGWNGL